MDSMFLYVFHVSTCPYQKANMFPQSSSATPRYAKAHPGPFRFCFKTVIEKRHGVAYQSRNLKQEGLGWSGWMMDYPGLRFWYPMHFSQAPPSHSARFALGDDPDGGVW